MGSNTCSRPPSGGCDLCCVRRSVRPSDRLRGTEELVAEEVAAEFLNGESRSWTGRHAPGRFDDRKREVTSNTSCVRRDWPAPGFDASSSDVRVETGRMCLHGRHRTRGWTTPDHDASRFGGARQTRWYHCRGDETATDSALDLREWTFSACEGLGVQIDASVGTMTWLRSWRRDPDAPRFSSCRSRRVRGSRRARFGLLRPAASLACRAAHSFRLRLDRWMPGALFCLVARFGVATFASSEAASGRRCCPLL